jgi:tRNA nucleotidyltransferase (CCA-adding enzyme)
MRAVLKEALKKFCPSEKEEKRIRSVVEKVKSKLDEEIRRRNLDAEITLGGSIAKQTWIAGIYDIDFFLRFDPSYEPISKLCYEICKACFKRVEVIHASRDYYRTREGKYDIEIVPVLLIENPKQAWNSMDVSPFHVRYVSTKVRANPKIANEARLLKQFCIANNCYGAETHLHGFSGYVLELLMIYFKTFENLVRASERMEPKVFIDIEGHYKNKKEAFTKLTQPKLKSPLILIDPILPNRNAAAALNYPVFSRFLFALRNFKRDPRMRAFEEKRVDEKYLKELSQKKGTKLFLEKLPIKKPEHIFFAKLVRRLKRIKSSLEKEGFRVYDYGFLSREKQVLIFFELGSWVVSKAKRHLGPPVWVDPKHFDSFMKRWKRSRKKIFGPYVYRNRLAVDVKRELIDPGRLIKRLLAQIL